MLLWGSEDDGLRKTHGGKSKNGISKATTRQEEETFKKMCTRSFMSVRRIHKKEEAVRKMKKSKTIQTGLGEGRGANSVGLGNEQGTIIKCWMRKDL